LLDSLYIEKRSLLKEIIKSKKYVRGSKLLDIGCGDKPYEQYFSVNLYVGIDYPIKRSVSKYPKRSDIYADALYLPFKSKSFDVVLSTQVIEHVPDPNSMFKEINRVLRGGSFNSYCASYLGTT